LAPAVYNAANETCVDAFCAGRLDFPGIVDVIADVVDTHLSLSDDRPLSVAGVLAADSWARAEAAHRIDQEY
jgi:1-deoxy-D-xylulose-5-phosphate reductoisomerase